MKKILFLSFLLIFSSCSSLKKEVTYKLGDTEFQGYFAKSKKEGKRPAVIVVHEWWGLNSYARKRADMLADMGYHAFALDMYGKGKRATHPKDAGAFAKEALKNPKMVKEKFEKVIELLKNDKDVDADKIAAIGYCFGGAVVLNMARMGVDLDGVVSYHGSLAPLEKARKVKAKVLVYNGEADPMVTSKDIRNFKREMKRARVDYKFVNFKGAKHAFTNPEATELGEKFKLPLAYDKEADEVSWKGTQEFLNKIF